MSLSIDKTSPDVLSTKYEVRGAVYIAALERLKQGKEVVFTSVGNPQGLGQKPLTFLRQVMALVAAPFLMDDPTTAAAFPSDAIARAKEYLADFVSLGAYTDSRGTMSVRKQVAAFLERRDGLKASPDNIFLTDGASVAVRLALRMLIRGPGFRDGILVPIPQYPLYSAAIALLGGELIPYHLCEEEEWGMDMGTIATAVQRARKKGVTPRGLVFINPGNPTGQQLTEQQLYSLLELCHTEKLTLLADEVYQDNVYAGARPFISARSVLAKCIRNGSPMGTETQLLTFHTASKGYCGECGMRGGMVELMNIPADVLSEMYKLASINLSPNVPGQVALGVMLCPPQPGDPSYALYREEKDSVIASLGRRAAAMTESFSLPGMRIVAAGSMYAYPQIEIPPAAVKRAAELGLAPDVFYCIELLNETGIAATPGSGFGQKDGTFHFRTTILPPEEKMEWFKGAVRDFHMKFLQRWGADGHGKDTASGGGTMARL